MDVDATDGVGVTEVPETIGVKVVLGVAEEDALDMDAMEGFRLGEGVAAGVAYGSRPSGNTVL